jgi:hypothetical protein
MVGCGCQNSKTAEAALVGITGSSLLGKVGGLLACKTTYIAAFGVAGSVWGYFAAAEKVNYKPVALSVGGFKVYQEHEILATNPSKTEGTPENDLIIAYVEGGKIFAKGGLNYLVAGPGVDKFYFSLCSTDIIENKVGVIEGFDSANDFIHLFCTKKIITKNNIQIIHDNIDGQDITYIQAQGNDKISAIALLGDINITVENIVLNEKWADA